jgi:glycosyltransferase XagB
MKRILAVIIFLLLAGFVGTSQINAQSPKEENEMVVRTRDQALDALQAVYPTEVITTNGQQSEVLAVNRNSTGTLENIKYFIIKPRPTASEGFIVVCLLLLLPQGIFTVYWMLYAWNDPNKADRSQSPREYFQPQYSFTALLPARKEEAVIKDTIYALNAINYPDHLKEILVLVRDEDDDGTINKVNETIRELGNPRIRLVTFTDGPKNKPNGLNRGYKIASNDVVCIFDAEDEPHPDIYDIINTVMLRDGADVVQSGVQLMNFSSNWFSALNCLEYFFWFKSGLHLFTNILNVTPLGGNTVFFKREWLEQVNGWDEGLLTEDADIGIRMTLQGAKIQVVYDAKHVTQEETPANADQFIKQRTRWSQGFYEIFFKFDWLKLPTLKQKLGAIYILLNPIIQAAMIFYLPIGIFVALTQQVALGLAIASYIPLGILIVELLITLAGIREFVAAYDKRLPKYFTLKMMVAYYPFQLMLASASFRACYRFLKGQSAWEKTTHTNLHRKTSHAEARPEAVS